MNALTQELVDLLTLEKLEENIYRGISRNLVGKRVFGGQVLGQALRAASYTTDRPAHSLHAYFLYGGDINAPIIYEVDRLRDGKSFVSRQVRAIQHGRVIFSAMVSFANPEEGLNYQHQEPEYPAPETLKSENELKEGILNFVPENVRASFMRERHVEIRPIDPVNPFQPQPEAPYNAHYIRTHDRIPKQLDDIALHQAIVAFYSDFTLMTTALRPHGLSYISPSLQCASIDHAIYFHRPLRADEWMLYDMEATVSAASRGLNFGRMWQNGQLVCSTVQEGLIRLREIETQ
ncbi:MULTISPECIES: acyl-CoA thioesterase [Acinetobacter]|jgi:acyl-CoA thioesterase-2|uniref:Acyl-CoA thioesterase 2 n=3 Tax=Acinetobacter TaxID=469 RepID=A0A0M3C0N8_ACIPI|nr:MULTISPECIES: acyl-CoA thioesterase II [Acinetobacter]AMO39589.1 acyl-CoA thioesterase II [Acinetobacter sp. DUT-2]EXS23107.1 thioesterase-like superfamily protein [Acinetobacter baumannii 573719]KCY70908.1 thioesterase-like superfamily protein [Acinetobacter baumannii 1288284]OBA09705.1 acyl-CoA thioesterase II [Acinetobacter calcoaceticus]QNB04362.1 acyl-CoA thioesterase II [Acinetobacter baumannii]TDM61486.1 acyl-CoA thioesterase II [Acinetobacter sp. KU 011TH]TDM61603.1 acyl-CoA thioe